MACRGFDDACSQCGSRVQMVARATLSCVVKGSRGVRVERAGEPNPAARPCHAQIAHLGAQAGKRTQTSYSGRGLPLDTVGVTRAARQGGWRPAIRRMCECGRSSSMQ